MSWDHPVIDFWFAKFCLWRLRNVKKLITSKKKPFIKTVNLKRLKLIA